MRPLRQGVHGAAEGGCAAWQGCSQTGAWWRGAPALSLAAHRRARGSGQRGRMRRQPRGSDHSSERMRERGSRIGEEEALVEEKTPSPSTPNLQWPLPCVPARWPRPATPSPCRVAAAAPISTAAPHGFFLCVCDSDRLPRLRGRAHI